MNNLMVRDVVAIFLQILRGCVFFPPSRNFLRWNEMIVEIVQHDCSELHQYRFYQGELLLNSMETFPWLYTSDHKFKDVAKQISDLSI